MISSIALDRTTTALHKGMNASQHRHRVIANNIANVNTPGFKSSSVVFERELARALDRQAMRGTITSDRHIPLGAPTLDRVRSRMITHNDESMRNDLNSVDVEHEMAELSKNQLYYSALTERMSWKFTQLSTVISRSR